MFGHKKGAFTGPTATRRGCLEAADGGTLFLDELGEMPMPLQAKLLRVLQDGVVRRVGSEKPDAVVNVRFVAATNRDPHDAMRTGLLREDLVLPPVRGAGAPPPAAPAARGHRDARRALPRPLLGAPPPRRDAGAGAERGGARPSSAPARGRGTCASCRTSSST
jgi:hypothetical protein